MSEQEREINRLNRRVEQLENQLKTDRESLEYRIEEKDKYIEE